MNFEALPDLPFKVESPFPMSGSDDPRHGGGGSSAGDESLPFAETDAADLPSSRFRPMPRQRPALSKEELRCPNCKASLVCHSQFAINRGNCPTCGVELFLAVKVGSYGQKEKLPFTKTIQPTQKS